MTVQTNIHNRKKKKSRNFAIPANGVLWCKITNHYDGSSMIYNTKCFCIHNILYYITKAWIKPCILHLIGMEDCTDKTANLKVGNTGNT